MYCNTDISNQDRYFVGVYDVIQSSQMRSVLTLKVCKSISQALGVFDKDK